jgi:5-dehydro-2-deoxygluconokinase
LDLICLGRLAVDLYAQQVGARLEDATSFAKYLGGSPANIAFGAARLELKSAMLSRVGDDPMGRFLVETLRREGCNTRGIKIDKSRLTALVLLGLKDRDTFPLVFYRENCADMALCEDDVEEEFIASARALLLSGTHLSRDGVHKASVRALEYATRHGLARVLDIDYRPVLWGLTGLSEAETRYVSDPATSRRIQSVLPSIDLVFGTEEEFLIAGGGDTLSTALSRVRELTEAALVVKLGERGCFVVRGPIPEQIDKVSGQPGIGGEALNVLSAGDAFDVGFLYSWLNGGSDERCAQIANACDGLVVSRHACAPAMPTRAELDYILSQPGAIVLPDLNGQVDRLHHASAKRREWGPLYILAFDHRRQLIDLAQATGRDLRVIPDLKRLLYRAVECTALDLERQGAPGNVGLLADERFAQDVLNAATGRGWWIGRPVELPGSRPVVFEQGRSIGTALVQWPREQIVKCRVLFHPDDEPMLRLEQEAQLKSLYDATRASGHELLVELIPPKIPVEVADVLPRAIQRLYDIGIYPEWWKLQPQPRTVWQRLDELILGCDPYCRGVVLLGLNARADEVAQGFVDAADSRVCRGFAVGRTIFQEPARAWLIGEIDDRKLVGQVQSSFEYLIRAWRATRGLGSGSGARVRM